MKTTSFWDSFVESVQVVKSDPTKYQEICAGVNSHDENGDTPLMITSRIGHTEASKLLIGMGANIDAQNIDGLTALMFAVHNNHIEIVKLLLDNNVNVNIITADGLTALRAAKIGTGLTKLFVRSKIIAMLHQAGARC